MKALDVYAVRLIELWRIIPDPRQPRTEFDNDELQLLAQSIKERGLKYPLRVRPATWDELQFVSSELREQGGDFYLLLAGERRFRAHGILEAQTVPCNVRDEELSEAETFSEQLIDDLHTVALTAMERAHAFKKAMDMNRCSASELADHLKISRKKVFRSLQLLELAPEIQSKVGTDALPAQAAYLLCELKDHSKQIEVASRIEKEDLPTRAVRTIVRRMKTGPMRRRAPTQTRTKRSYHVRRGSVVVVKSKTVLSDLQIARLLERAQAEAYHDALATTKAGAEGCEVKVDLSQLIKLLQEIKNASGSLQSEIADLLNDLGIRVLMSFRQLLNSDDPGVTREYMEILQSLGTEFRVLLESFRRVSKTKQIAK